MIRHEGIITALIGGQLQAALLPPGLAMQQVKAGKLKAIGVTSERRSVLATDLPTLREVGVLGADVELWTALAGPASLPAAVREKLAAAVIDTVKLEETRQRLITVGCLIRGRRPRFAPCQLAIFASSRSSASSAVWARIVRQVLVCHRAKAGRSCSSATASRTSMTCR